MEPATATHRDTVFIVDDDASVRDSLSLLLSLQGYATATFASGEDLLAVLQPEWSGCVVADLRMPGMSGLQLQRHLRERAPHIPLVMVTAHGDVAAAREAFLANAVDFIEKPFDAAQLVAAVEAARRRTAAGAGRQEAAAPGALDQVRERLSPREREVMDLMIRGMHNRHIAAQLDISPRTVEVHKARVMEKLGVRNLVEFVRLVDGAGGR